jgi:preprotein translocase subunit SecG
MSLLMNLLVVLQVLAALAMIGLILIQHGKGADMGAAFGSGASGSLFGASGSANFLSRSTAILAAVFFICTLTLAYLSTSQRASQGARTGSVLDQHAVNAPAASSPASAASIALAASATLTASSGASAASAALDASGASEAQDVSAALDALDTSASGAVQAIPIETVSSGAQRAASAPKGAASGAARIPK